MRGTGSSPTPENFSSSQLQHRSPISEIEVHEPVKNGTVWGAGIPQGSKSPTGTHATPLMSAELLPSPNRCEHQACSPATVLVIPQWYSTKKKTPFFGQQNIWISPTGTANNILIKSWSEERLNYVHKYCFGKELMLGRQFMCMS